MKLEREMQCSLEELCDLMCGGPEEEEDGTEYVEEYMQVNRFDETESASGTAIYIGSEKVH